MKSVLQTFAEVAARTPKAPALRVEGEVALTYGQLREQAARLGARLVEAGAGPEAVLGIAIPRSPEYLVAVLGAWYAGAAFVPLDPDMPDKRRTAVVLDAAPSLLLSRTAPRPGDVVPVIQVEDRPGPEAPLPDLQPGQLAYLLYTSGSTGEPKGVEVLHRGLPSLIEWQIHAFGLHPQARFLQFLSLSFDASISDILTTLLSGACLCFEPRARPSTLLRLAAARRLTHMDLPPSLLPRYDPTLVPACLETLVLGGEPSPPELIRRFAERVRVVSVYGPTEATICASLTVVDPERWDAPLLGKAVPGARMRVVNDALEEVTRGGVGELLLGGPCLARGYRNRPDLTRERFLEVGGQRWYRTGDLVEHRLDGEMRFVGRKDRQVQLRGQRVEPQEIEVVLTSAPGVSRAAVVPTPGEQHGLVAFVEPVPTQRAPTGAELRDHLAQRLPAYMVPDRIEVQAGLPTTPSGKVDVAALSQAPLPVVRTLGAPPKDETEAALCALWAEVLGLGEVGRDQEFHALGGDSLAAIEIAAAAEARGLKVSPAMLSGPTTIAELVERLRASAKKGDPAGRVGAAWIRRQVAFDAAWRARLARAAKRPGAPPHPGRPRVVLLTGATGFLGARVLSELLLRTSAEVRCLVRADSPLHGLRRITEALDQQGLTLGPLAGRVRAVPGDISKPMLGVSRDDWGDLADEVDAVVHMAARVNTVETWSSLKAPNVRGTREVLRLVATGRRKRLTYASTLSVFVSTDRNQGTLSERDDLSLTEWVYGGYAQTKWGAEVMVREAAGKVGPVTILRYGLLTGDTRTGRSARDDFLHLFVRGLGSLGCVPAEGLSRLAVDITPVDYAARATVELMLRVDPGARCSTFHLANSRSLKLRELVSTMDACGVQLQRLRGAAFHDHLAERGPGHDPAAGAAYLALCRCLADDEGFARQRTMDLFQATGVVFDTAATQATLEGTGIACPPPDGALVFKYVTRALGDRKIDAALA